MNIYIDDKNMGGVLGWCKIWKILGNEIFTIKQQDLQNKYNNSFLSIFKKK